MKQVSQNYKSGAIRLEDVSAPLLKAGGVLVSTQYSVISLGTEVMKVKEGKMSYLGKARARPDQVKKVLHAVQQQGLLATYQKVMNKLESLSPLGYSLSGIVTTVGSGAEQFEVGQRVACAGAGYANHAEINFVPRNLVVPVPENVSMKHAAFTTIGAIAMQGFRQAEIQLGETACVIGLGMLGLLLVQILRAAGIQVIGIDLIKTRCQLAQQLGASAAIAPDDPGLYSMVKRFTGGVGVDCVLLSASSTSSTPVELAAEIARDRARVVNIGKSRLDLPYNEYYLKELDFRFSRSYGPGRYDPQYEEQGIDYPIGHVRWTERRNMVSFVELIAAKQIELEPIISSVRPFSEAEQVYQELADGKSDSIGIVFEYPRQPHETKNLPTLTGPETSRRAIDGKVNLGVIGAGTYASSMLLPHLLKHKDVRLIELATVTSLSGENAIKKFGFKRASTDYSQLLSASDIDAVIIATRPSSHAHIAVDALRSGKSVFVEKPLALTFAEIELVRRTIVESGNDRLMVGFNRRFSPLMVKSREHVTDVKAPLMMLYRVHAGQLEVGSWGLDPSEGSRFLGEAAHFFDVFAFLTGSRPTSLTAKCLRPPNVIADDLENIAVITQYENGSVGNLLFLTQGGSKVPKEYLEIFSGGRTVQLHNFESLQIFQGDHYRKIRGGRLGKGQKEEMNAFVSAVKSGSRMPISIDCLLDTTLSTLAVADSLRTGQPVQLSDYWETKT